MRLLSSPWSSLLVLALATGCGSAGSTRAQGFLDRGDYPGAAQAADAELSKRPSDAALHRIRLRAALGMGDARGAVDHYQAWRGGKHEDLAGLRTMAMTTLWQGLKSPSAQLRVQAVRAIERLQLEDFAVAVGERMGDDDDAVAAAAAVAVMRTYGQAGEVAERMLQSEDPAARAIAVEGIGRKVGAPAGDDLRAALTDRDPRVRAAAVFAVGRLGDGADTANLVLRAADPSAEVRAIAIRALAAGKRGPHDAVVDRGLGDDALGVRLAAVELAFAGRGQGGARALLTHRDPMVAAQAARLIKDPAAATPVLDRALAADDVATRVGAVGLVNAALGKTRALARARTATADAAPAVRVAAARLLGYLGDRAGAINVLAEVAAGADRDASIDAAAELIHLGDERGRDVLARAAADPEPLVRRDVVFAHLAARVITPGLWLALADDSASNRLDAAATLIELGAR